MTKEEILKKISDAVVSGKPDLAREGALEALKQGVRPVEAINEGLVKGMAIVGDRFALHQTYLPQVLISSQALYAGLDILLPAIPKTESLNKKTVAVAVVEGDVHDIGKNILKTLIIAGGYQVLDLGKDVPTEKVLEITEKQHPDVLALSTLMTPTLIAMRDAVDGLVESGYRSKVLVAVGGAPVSHSFSEEIGADHKDNDAINHVAWLKGVL
ncbi:MAG: cobalamin-dependent protein [Candidatus Methanoplasma sp.]|jgi:corrinoid protein of di/trimethylamine methyltransferase|nr:cobalamin-dependent protein [Candidatus Methanoplasma sp.]